MLTASAKKIAHSHRGQLKSLGMKSRSHRRNSSAYGLTKSTNKSNSNSNFKFLAKFNLKHQSWFKQCPYGVIILTAGLFLGVYTLLINSTNGLELERARLQRSLAKLRAEQNQYRLAMARRHVIDPQIIEQSWNEPKTSPVLVVNSVAIKPETPVNSVKPVATNSKPLVVSIATINKR